MKKENKQQIIKKLSAILILVAMCVLLIPANGQAGAEEASQEENLWKSETTMPTAKRGCKKIFEKDGKVYILGGIKSTASSNEAIDNKVDIYDTVKKTWSTGADLPAPHAYSNFALVGNKIYVMGGQSIGEDKKFSDVYVYDIEEDVWDTAASMPESCSGASTVAIENLIYVMDGSSESGNRLVQIYNTKTDSWTTKAIPSSVQQQAHAACHVYDGKIYVLGGQYWTTKDVSVNTVNIYDPVENSWSTGNEMPVKPSGCASVIRDDKIYIMGGTYYPSNGELSRLDDVYIYDITKDSWSEGATLSSARGGSTAVLIEDKIYIFGGVEGKTWEPTDKVEVLDLNPKEDKLRILMYENEKQQLSINYNLEDNKEYQWTSSDESVVTVNESGVATAISEGDAEVTVKNDDGSYEEVIAIKVLSMRKLAAHIQVDGTVRLYLTEDPSTVTWKSDNEAIATVDETGMVTGKKKGLVAITAELDGKKYELYVRVAEK